MARSVRIQMLCICNYWFGCHGRLWVVGARLLKLRLNFFYESLILAQDERWRRA